MEVSDFIQENECSQPKAIEKFIPFGENSMSCFYIAQIGGKQYFMKQLKPEFKDNALLRSLYRKEFEAGHSIHHPNIVKYIEITDNEQECYIFMENIVGETLVKFIASHHDYFKSRSNLDKFFNQLLSGLKCLHESHIVHSDLKPQNIMISQINNDLKIIDLGFCFTDSFPTTVGTTLAYAAPEQKSGEMLVEVTDIYAVGKIIEYIAKNIDSNLPSVYAKIMIRCLKEQRKQRYQNTDDIIRLINRRKHSIKIALVSAISCIVLFLAFRSIIYTERFNSWWDSFEIIPTHVDYSIESNHIYYRIVDNDHKLCEVAGFSSTPNAYIQNELKINGELYRVTHIADEAFRGKEYLKSVHIPEGIETIGKYAFIGCTGLSTISIPNSVTHISEYAFHGCNKVYNLKISPILTEIPVGFISGSQIKKVVIPEGVTIIGLDAFGNCGKLKDVTLPSSLIILERGVFYNCTSLEKITIPQNVKSIGDYLFFECTSLKDIYNLAIEPQVIPPIHKEPSQITLHVPAESVEKYRNAEYWNEMNIVPIK